MNTLVAAVVVALLSAPAAPVPAQQWSAEQQEVWDFEEACWRTEDVASTLPCFHDDFVGWGNPDGVGVPTSKADREASFTRSFATEETTWVRLKPLEIHVHGDMAVAIYIATITVKNKATGEETTATERWTDVCLRENGRWSWIADHGGVIESS